MKNKLTLGSLFSGSGGFELAGILSGIEPVWNCEVEPFPIRVTTKRMPFVKHYGDICALKGDEVEPVDIISGGFPCQSVSIAGKREGVRHVDHGDDSTTRSGLFYEAIRIVKEMREKTNGQKPGYLVIENVPGLFSSNKGEDFHSVLKEIAGIKDGEAYIPRPSKWEHAGLILAEDLSIAWRLLDSQYFGVAQRRKRIYLVADLAGGSAGKILFESEGLQGYSAESFRAWQRAAGSAEEGAGEAGTICLNDQGGQRMDVTEDVTSTLRAEAHHPPVVAAGFCTEHSAKAHGIGYEEEKSPTLRTGTVPAAIALDYHPADSRIGVSDDDNMQTLTSRMGTGGNNVPLVMQCFGICSKGSNAMLSENPHSGFYEADTARTLDTNGCNPAVNQGGIAVVEENGSRPSHHGVGYSESDIMYTLNATEQHGVALAELKTLKIRCGRPGGGKDPLVQDNMSATLGCNNDQTLFEPTWSTSKASFFTEAAEEMANTLVATDYKDPPLINDTDGIEYIVRRLTPTECARLQGFPDWWCSDLGTDDPTDEEMEFWTDVFETHSKVVTHASKPKTEKQIRKWLKDPHTDSAAYKMWGNCISLPIGVFVLAGIVWADEKMLVNDAE